jgi:hypothetical protein
LVKNPPFEDEQNYKLSLRNLNKFSLQKAVNKISHIFKIIKFFYLKTDKLQAKIEQEIITVH